MNNKEKKNKLNKKVVTNKIALLNIALILNILLYADRTFAQEESVSDANSGVASILDTITDNVNIVGEEGTNYDEETGIFTASKNVKIKYKGTEIQADQAQYNRFTGEIKAIGNVSVFQNGRTFRGEEFVYNINQRSSPDVSKLNSSALKGNFEPLYYFSKKFDVSDGTGKREGKNVLKGGPVVMTTHDSAQPNYHVKSKQVTIYPGDKVVMKNVTFYAGKTPLFWLPYVSLRFDDELGYSFAPGFASNWGAYLLNRYGFLVGDKVLAKANLDIRTARGLGGGFDFVYLPARDKDVQWGTASFYYANDTDVSEGAFGTRAVDIDENRYRISVQHRVNIPVDVLGDAEDFYVNVDLNVLSDELMLEDFFPKENFTNPRPDNLVNLVKRFDKGEFNLLTRFRANDFFQTDSRLPEISLDFTRQPIFNTNLFYESKTSFAVLKEESETSIDNEFNRFDTYHQVSYPMHLNNWLSVVPRAGYRFTNYSSLGTNDATLSTSSLSRSAVHAGVEASVKFSKVYDNVNNPAWGLDGLKHVVKPYANYSYVYSSASDDEFGQLPKIDRLIRRTSLAPIDMAFFTPVDSVHEWNIVRVGLKNEFYTRRNGGVHRWLNINTYFQAFLEDFNDQFSTNANGEEREFSNIYNEITWHPVPWISLEVDSQFPWINDVNDYTQIISRLSWMPNKNFRFSVGHIFVQDHTFIEDTNQISLYAYAKLGENWGISASHRYEAEDSTLEYQQYTLHRDLTSWVASVGASIYDNRTGDKQMRFLLMFTLKDWPQFSLPVDLDTVGGSRE